ncbi:recombinase family protein [Sulfuricurvum sp.]|uniref:recombinase family protein n=1 Tax=Sulfuricurvum sp. TaxID=2025608 RepID=UPI002628F160|nr:recombinase family protein [Sulfuricurvum sp.]MDD2267661.1 recombinase family protein [Sulfuricurvum sp.]MDD2784250.1 recombinase family protein [Sulfuricurvum sp.]
MAVVGYVRVSTETQDTENQMGEIMRWALAHSMNVDKYVGESISSRKKEREIFDLVDTLVEGDILIVTELSRVARSVKELSSITETLINNKVRMVFLKEGLDISDNNPAGKMMLSILGSIAEFERDMISMRTKEAIKSKKAAGISVGRVEGSKNKEHKLMGKEKEIQKYLDMGISRVKIAAMLKVSRPTLYDKLEEMGIKLDEMETK